jgi:hypothetical protein
MDNFQGCFTKLRALKSLLDDGVIDAEEFSRIKRRMLEMEAPEQAGTEVSGRLRRVNSMHFRAHQALVCWWHVL